MPDVVMPQLSASMEAGTILRWLKSDGDPVRRGDELVEIETDKATETYEADGDGVLEVVAAVGETVPVGALIARLDRDGAPASPPPAPEAPRAAPVGAKGEATVIEATRGQGSVARRVAESRATIPDFTTAVVVDATAALAAREQLGALHDPPPALDDFAVKAAALALREHPRVNASYRDGRFEEHARVNVGVAISGEYALAVPTLFDADTKPLARIAADTRTLADKARAGTLTSPELAGATFTVASLAGLGVARFTPVITPPQAAALAVGAVDAAGRMELTLAADHRIVFPADAARFLARVRALLENPAALLV